MGGRKIGIEFDSYRFVPSTLPRPWTIAKSPADNHVEDLRRNWNIVRYEPIPSSWRREVLLDLVDRLLGEILVDLGDDAGLDVLVQRLAQVSEGARGCGDQQRLDVALAHQLFERFRHHAGEMVLLQIVPIGRFDRAAAGPNAGVAAARPVSALLVGRRVLVE